MALNFTVDLWYPQSWIYNTRRGTSCYVPTPNQRAASSSQKLFHYCTSCPVGWSFGCRLTAGLDQWNLYFLSSPEDTWEASQPAGRLPSRFSLAFSVSCSGGVGYPLQFALTLWFWQAAKSTDKSLYCLEIWRQKKGRKDGKKGGRREKSEAIFRHGLNSECWDECTLDLTMKEFRLHSRECTVHILVGYSAKFLYSGPLFASRWCVCSWWQTLKS